MLLESDRRTAGPTPRCVKAIRVGQNVIDYATGKEMPADKLAVHDVVNFKAARSQARRPADRQAQTCRRLEHRPAGDPQPDEGTAAAALNFDVVITQKDLFPRDPGLIYYPLVYIHGRASMSFGKDDLDALRRHLEPGGGTLFADAACGSQAFDASFRRFVAELLPNNPLVPIPRDDELYTSKVGFDLSDVQYTKAAGGSRDFPQLEGVKLNDHWASSTRSSTSAAPWNGTPASTARAILTRARSRSPPISSFTRRCRDRDDARCSRQSA